MLLLTNAFRQVLFDNGYNYRLDFFTAQHRFVPRHAFLLTATAPMLASYLQMQGITLSSCCLHKSSYCYYSPKFRPTVKFCLITTIFCNYNTINIAKLLMNSAFWYLRKYVYIQVGVHGILSVVWFAVYKWNFRQWNGLAEHIS